MLNQLLNHCARSVLGPRFLNNLAADIEQKRLHRASETIQAVFTRALSIWEEGAKSPHSAIHAIWDAIEHLSGDLSPEDVVSMEGPEVPLPEVCIRLYEDVSANYWLFRIVPTREPVGRRRAGSRFKEAVDRAYQNGTHPPLRFEDVYVRASRPFAFATPRTELKDPVRAEQSSKDATRLCGVLGLGHFETNRIIIGVEYPSREVEQKRGVAPTAFDGSKGEDCYLVVNTSQDGAYNHAADLPDCTTGVPEFLHASTKWTDEFISYPVGTLHHDLQPDENEFLSFFPVRWDESHVAAVLKYAEPVQ